MPPLNKPIGILGGTFDPVHNGHLRLAVELREQLRLDSIRLIPSARPPHREKPGAIAGQRAKWLRESVVAEEGLILDDRELLRPGLSYTIDTIHSLQEDYPNTPICLIMGVDVFSGFTEWKHWQKILDLVHLVIVPRPQAGISLCDELKQVVESRSTQAWQDLHESTGGYYYTGVLPPLSISGSGIRKLIREGRSARYLMPDRVWFEILREGIYRNTPDT